MNVPTCPGLHIRDYRTSPARVIIRQYIFALSMEARQYSSLARRMVFDVKQRVRRREAGSSRKRPCAAPGA